MGLGNIISQAMIEKKTIDSLDWPRVARFAAFGYLFSVEFIRFIRSQFPLLFQGPFLRYWYYGLDKFFHGARLQPVKMMLADQVNSSLFLFSFESSSSFRL